MRMIRLFVALAVLAVVLVMPAGAQFFGPAIASPTGGYAPGFSESVSWTSGVGAAASTDAVFNSIVSPFGGPFFGFGPFGGAAETGIGSNFGAENSAMGTFTRTTSFGLGQPDGLAFGIPVPGPGGLIYC